MNRFRIVSSVRNVTGVTEMPVFGEVLQLLGDCPVLCDQQDGSCQSYEVQRQPPETLAVPIAHPAGLIDVVSAARRVSGSMSWPACHIMSG